MRAGAGMVLLLLAGVAVAAAPPPAPLAGYYEGDLPCADCQALRYRLELRDDRAYVLETEYVGKPKGPANPRAALGVWSASADGRTVVFRGRGEAPLLFAADAPGVLRKLDAEGRPIASKLNYALRRRERSDSFTPLLRLEGSYSDLADAGNFRECLSRARFPVAQEADNAALERGYSAARPEPGAELLVTVEARIAPRPAADGPGTEDSLVVEKFIGAWPGESCGDPLAQAPLLDTEWQLTRLGDRAVRRSAAGRGPELRLRAEGRQVEGFGGCNRFMGGYRLDGQSLSFGRLAATMMACPPAEMDQEAAFMQALNTVGRWQAIGEHLDLQDASGRMVARFEMRQAGR